MRISVVAIVKSVPTRHKAICHVDMDMFYVAVELRRRPDLRGKPVVVGGDGSRGVVAAASYEARRYGVFSAMSSATAKRLCPQAIFLPGDMDLYQQVSEQVFDIFHDVTPLVEGLSLDEAFLDVTGSIRLFGEPEVIADSIRSRVRTEVGLPCSIGIAPSKFIAKLASKAAKPIADRNGVRDGLGVLRIEPGKELDFILPLPVKAVWGVGPATLEKLLGVGIHTVGDLAAVDLDVLEGIVGVAHARHLHDLAHARDDRDVIAEREAKSIGNEETFSVDLTTHDEVRAQVVRLADNVAHRCRTAGQLPLTVTLKIKYADFEVVTRSKTSPFAVTSAQAMVQLLEDALAEVTVRRGVRLVGVSARNFGESSPQLSLFDDPDNAEGVESAWAPTAEAIDEIRARFGHSSIGPASALRGGRRPGSSPWGPNSAGNDS